MAEALLRVTCPDYFEVESAGLEPGKLNPMAVEALREIGIDIATKETRAIDDLVHSGARFDYVITVCDDASAERCPTFPGVAKRMHWSFPDPSTFTGTEHERLERTREVRETIRERVESWCEETCAAPSA